MNKNTIIVEQASKSLFQSPFFRQKTSVFFLFFCFLLIFSPWLAAVATEDVIFQAKVIGIIPEEGALSFARIAISGYWVRKDNMKTIYSC